jgi:hypothetical protein
MIRRKMNLLRRKKLNFWEEDLVEETTGAPEQAEDWVEDQEEGINRLSI